MLPTASTASRSSHANIKPLTAHSTSGNPMMIPSHMWSWRRNSIELDLCSRPARTPETEIQQPHAARDRDRAEYGHDARHDSSRSLAHAVVHDVQRPQEIVPTPQAMKPRDQRNGTRMQ